MKVKFICLNLWHGELLDNAVQFLKQQDADIVALQEVCSSLDPSALPAYRSLERLRAEWPSFSLAYAPAYEDERGVIDGNAILSRYPIVKSQAIFYHAPFTRGVSLMGNVDDNIYKPRCLQLATLDIHGRSLFVGNTQGVWGTDGEDNPRRLEMANIISEQAQGKRPLILAGDFNVREQTQTIATAGQGLTNIFQHQLTTTFNLKYKTDPGGFATSVVDFIFVSSEVHVLEHSAIAADISDHQALVCAVEM